MKGKSTVSIKETVLFCLITLTWIQILGGEIFSNGGEDSVQGGEDNQLEG